MSVEVGDSERCTVTFLVGNTASDPTLVYFMLRDPFGNETSQIYGGTSTSTSIVREQTGVFHMDVTWPSPKGVWAMRWKGTGAVNAAVEMTVDVVSSFDNP